MAKAPPAFQFYPESFEQGTDTMTLAEVGGYMRLLNSQWANGSIPGDHIKRLAAIMRCTPSLATRVWAVVAEKFVRAADGTWRNARMESERQRQDEYRRVQSQRGKASALKRPIPNTGSTAVQPSAVAHSVQPSAVAHSVQPEGNPRIFQPEGNSLISVSKKERTKEQDRGGVQTPQMPRPSAPPPLVMSPKEYENLLRFNSFVGSRLVVPHVLHGEFRRGLGGPEAESRLMAWYESVNAEAEEQALDTADVFRFLRPRFKAWASQNSDDAAIRKFVEAE